MKRPNFKVVKDNPYNEDQYLMGFYANEKEANEARLLLPQMFPAFVKSAKDLLVKRVNIELIPCPVATDYAHYIRSLIPDKEWKRVMESDAAAEIDSNDNVCGYGGRTYYNLSKMIPKDWTVLDFGCAYNPQSYLFMYHQRHIAIEPEWLTKDFCFDHFQAPHTEFYTSTGEAFIKKTLPTLGLDLKKTFAICNFVPSDECCQMVRETFPNVFTFYPA